MDRVNRPGGRGLRRLARQIASIPYRDREEQLGGLGEMLDLAAQLARTPVGASAEQVGMKATVMARDDAANRVEVSIFVPRILAHIPLGTGEPAVAVPPSLVVPNYDRLPVGQREGIEAGAFLARTNDAGANWYNPAGLALAHASTRWTIE